MEGEENKLTTFSTWAIMLGCNSSISANLGNSGENSHVFGQAMKKRPTGHTLWPEKEIIAATLSCFCELVEGEENKLTTFPHGLRSSAFDLLGPSASRCTGPYLCRPPVCLFKLIPGHYKKYSHFKGRDTAPTTSSQKGSCIIDSSTSGTLADAAL